MSVKVISILVLVACTYAQLPTILYDLKHHKAMIVSDKGCYEYHLTHQDITDLQNDAGKAALETKMILDLAQAVNFQEMGHNHINHMTGEIRNACASLPVYSWELPVVSTMSPVVVT